GLHVLEAVAVPRRCDGPDALTFQEHFWETSDESVRVRGLSERVRGHAYPDPRARGVLLEGPIEPSQEGLRRYALVVEHEVLGSRVLQMLPLPQSATEASVQELRRVVAVLRGLHEDRLRFRGEVEHRPPEGPRVLETADCRPQKPGRETPGDIRFVLC